MADVWRQASDLLDDVVLRVAVAPDRTYVSDGTPAFDCEQLVLHVFELSVGTAQQSRPTRAMSAPMLVAARFTRLWKVPVIERSKLPSEGELRASGEQVVKGGFDLWQAVAAAANDHHCRPAVDTAVSVGPEGAFAGWQVPVRWNP